MSNRMSRYMWEDGDTEIVSQPDDTTKAVNVKPPAHALDYWKDHDALMSDLGHSWLSDYMRKAYSNLAVSPDLDANKVQSALDAYHDDFAKQWLGTEDAPGPLVKLIQAGMAAGQQAINHGSAANPARAMLGKATVEVDWDLLAHEARDFAQQYLFNLIRNIDDTTRKAVSDAVAKWIESGESLDKLKDALNVVFHDEARANLIAQTESTRAFAEGTKERYRRADIKQVNWNTVKDNEVCPSCRKLLDSNPHELNSVAPPQHPGCRCWLRPVVEE